MPWSGRSSAGELVPVHEESGGSDEFACAHDARIPGLPARTRGVTAGPRRRHGAGRGGAGCFGTYSAPTWRPAPAVVDPCAGSRQLPNRPPRPGCSPSMVSRRSLLPNDPRAWLWVSSRFASVETDTTGDWRVRAERARGPGPSHHDPAQPRPLAHRGAGGFGGVRACHKSLAARRSPTPTSARAHLAR